MVFVTKVIIMLWSNPIMTWQMWSNMERGKYHGRWTEILRLLASAMKRKLTLIISLGLEF